MLFKSNNFIHEGNESTCVDIFEAENPSSLKLIALHGAGKSDKNRCHAICSAFAENGVSSIAPDLSGAGNSKHTKDLTLNHRLETAKSVINYYIHEKDKFIVVAFSMSGQTAIDLSIEYGDRLLCLVLFSPAIYSTESMDKPFGSAFSDAIRKENSWMKSSSPASLTVFNGKLFLITPENDTVIPKGVFEIIKQNTNTENFKEIIIKDAPHTLGSWLNENPSYAEYIARVVLSTLGLSTNIN